MPRGLRLTDDEIRQRRRHGARWIVIGLLLAGLGAYEFARLMFRPSAVDSARYAGFALGFVILGFALAGFGYGWRRKASAEERHREVKRAKRLPPGEKVLEEE